MDTPALRLTGVSRSFGPVHALRDVDLDIRIGEVHALIGENGAGKSTLLNVVSGLLAPDRGTVEAHGSPLPVADRSASLAAGIGVVHQHFSLVGSLTGAENFELGRPSGARRVDRERARSALAEWGARTGLEVDPDVVVDELTIGGRQRLEILTTLAWGARVLLLDEPTAVLAPTEADQLLEVVRDLAASGLAVVLVTHKLREVERHADRVTVLRGGEVVGRHHGAVSRDVLVAEMVGAGVEDAVLYTGDDHRARPAGESVLVYQDVQVGRLRGVNLELFAGQVTGLAGVIGSGQAELVATACGLLSADRGRVTVFDRDGAAVVIAGDPGRAAAVGVALIPEDRERDAIASALPVWNNAVAKHTDGIGGWRGVDRGAVRRITDRIIGALGVRPATHGIAAGRLSGGNQQRLVIGRELDRAPRVVLASEPTRGLDPASAIAVIDALRLAAAAGAAVLVAASDLDELMLMSDRVVALCDGRITLDVGADHVDRNLLGRAMAGVT